MIARERVQSVLEQAKSCHSIAMIYSDFMQDVLEGWLSMESALEFVRAESKTFLENTAIASHENAVALRIFSVALEALASARKKLEVSK